MIVRAASLLALLLLFSCGGEPAHEGPRIAFYTDDIGEQLSITREMAADFERETGIRVDFQIGPQSATERLAEYLRFFASRSERYDVYQIDVVWPGLLADYLVDLSGTVDPAEHFPAMIQNNRVDGRLVAVPFYGDAGLLYYRTDLLGKYGFDGPPGSLADLERMARTIMEGERAAGNDAFWGYVFQGASYEGLTCNALEWQAGARAGNFLEGEDGKPSLTKPAFAAVLGRVRGWVGDIAPPGVLTYKEEESRLIFHQGNAAFMRNWPYAYRLAQAEESPVRGVVRVMAMPGEERAASTLGGWSLAVSRFSDDVESAQAFVRYLSTREAQLRRAIDGGYLATRPDVYTAPEVAEAMPWYPAMREVFLNAVARPAAPAGEAYNEISAAYHRAVHDVLSGDGDAVEVLAEAEDRMRAIRER